MMRHSIQWFCIEVATYLKWIISNAPWHYPNLFNIWHLHPLLCHTVHHLHFDGGRPSSHQPLVEPILSLCLKMPSICQFINRTNESIDLHLSTSYFVSIALTIELWDMRCFQEERSILGRLSPCGPIIVLAVSHPHWVWVTVGKLEPQTWQSCWVGLRPSGINLLRYPCAIHLRFDNGHEEQLIYAAASLWKAWNEKSQASRGWTWRTLFTLKLSLRVNTHIVVQTILFFNINYSFKVLFSPLTAFTYLFMKPP